MLVAERENRVFKVTGSGQYLALRLHRKGLRSSAELNSELLWMATLSGADIDVPAPIASRDGQFSP